MSGNIIPSPAKYGEMHMYEETLTVTFNTVNVYHAIFGFHVGSLKDFIFVDGKVVDANITAESNPSAALLQIETSGAHGLATGDIVTQSNMNDVLHNGATRVTVLDATNYTCQDIAYVAGAGASAGVIYSPSYLQAGQGAEGFYLLNFSLSGSSAANAKTFKWELNCNQNAIDTIVTERKHAVTDMGCVASSGFSRVSPGDRVWLSGKNKTDANNFVIEHTNVNLHRIS